MERPPHWRDALVELHVLAEHGDRAATTQAHRWLARDPQARQLWDTVEQVCDAVRRHAGSEPAQERNPPR